MAAPAFRDETTSTREDTTAATTILTVPADVVEGDYMLAVALHGDGGNFYDGAPTGWRVLEMLTSDTGSDKRVGLFGKFADADDETNAGTKTYTFTGSSNEGSVGSLVAYSNVNAVVTYAGRIRAVHRSNDTTPLGPTWATSHDDAMVLHVLAMAASTSAPTVPTGTTSRSADSINGGGVLDLTLNVADEVKATAGSGTQREWTNVSSAADGFGIAVVLMSADEGPTATNHLTKSNGLNPLRQYRFDEGTGTTATDHGSDGLDGGYGDESTSDDDLTIEHTLSEPVWVDDWAGNAESAIDVSNQDNEMMDSNMMSDESITIEVIAKWTGTYPSLGDTQRKQLVTQTTSAGDSNDG